MQVFHAVDERRLRELRERDEFFWVDLVDPTHEQVMAIGDLLGLHHLALEDTLEFRQPPKLDGFGDHVQLVFYTVRRLTAERFEPLEIHLYVHGGFLITVRHGACDELDRLIATLPDTGPEDEELAVYRVLDALCDGFEPVIAMLDPRIDALEAEVFTRPRQGQLEAVYALKQDVQAIARRVADQRDGFPAAAEAILALPGFHRGTHPYMADVRDHLQEIAGNLARFEADLVALTSTFFNASANRLNQQAARLSVIATIFLTATLVSSFFGQNFGWMVEHLSSRRDFLVFGVGGMVGAMLVTAAYFVWKRKDYF